MASLYMSFVIPALNEAVNIANTLSVIKQVTERLNIMTELIVVDHGSNDGTPDIAKSLGAKVINQLGGTIGGLRNRGAKEAEGNLLIFIDADVTLTSSWAENIMAVATPLIEGEKLLTGSHCAPPESSNILLKHWFGSFARDPRNTHLGTGHMIISKAGFAEVGGFDERLRTGEDYEFCERAKASGYRIRNISTLKVIHHDFPKDLSSFVAREIWHGRGDLGTLSDMLASKVVWGSLVFLGLHALILLGVLVGEPVLVMSATGFLFALLLGSSIIKNRHSEAVSIFYNTGIFYFYYLGRSIAFLKRLVITN